MRYGMAEAGKVVWRSLKFTLAYYYVTIASDASLKHEISRKKG